MDDLYGNFGGAFVVICPLMIFAVRSCVLGLLAMIPNIFPAILVFGGLGFLHYPIVIAIALTACVSHGIAVDDTTHLLIRFRELEQNEPSSRLALKKHFISAPQRCSIQR